MSKTVVWVLLVLFFLAAPAWAQPDLRPVLAQLEAEGYFAKCQAGEMRGCSYFVRLVALRANPNGDPGSWGTLTKPQGGSNVEGYADDAVALGQHASNNVYDLVVSSGTTAARTTVNGPLPRRASDLWEAPKPLSQAQMDYLKPGSTVPNPGTPVPNPGTPPPPPAVNLRPVLDAIQVIEQLISGLQADVNAYRVLLQDIARKAVDAHAAASDAVTRIDRAHQDILVIINGQKQPLRCSGRAPAFGGTITLTCQP